MAAGDGAAGGGRRLAGARGARRLRAADRTVQGHRHAGWDRASRRGHAVGPARAPPAGCDVTRDAAACARTQLLVMAKQPVPGRVKTRLASRYGCDGAAQLANAALLDTLDAVLASRWARRVLVLDGSPGSWLPAGFDPLRQRGAGLDQRLAPACEGAFPAL